MYYNVKLVHVKPSTVPGIYLVLINVGYYSYYFFLDGNDGDNNADDS